MSWHWRCCCCCCCVSCNFSGSWSSWPVFLFLTLLLSVSSDCHNLPLSLFPLGKHTCCLSPRCPSISLPFCSASSFIWLLSEVILPHKQKRIMAYGNKANIDLVWYLSTVQIYMWSSKNGLWPSCVVLSKGRKKKGIWRRGINSRKQTQMRFSDIKNSLVLSLCLFQEAYYLDVCHFSCHVTSSSSDADSGCANTTPFMVLQPAVCTESFILLCTLLFCRQNERLEDFLSLSFWLFCLLICTTG